jgi:hypothetical protein
MQHLYSLPLQVWWWLLPSSMHWTRERRWSRQLDWSALKMMMHRKCCVWMFLFLYSMLCGGSRRCIGVCASRQCSRENPAVDRVPWVKNEERVWNEHRNVFKRNEWIYFAAWCAPVRFIMLQVQSISRNASRIARAPSIQLKGEWYVNLFP